MSQAGDALATLEATIGNVQAAITADDKEAASREATQLGQALANLRASLHPEQTEPSATPQPAPERSANVPAVEPEPVEPELEPAE